MGMFRTAAFALVPAMISLAACGSSTGEESYGATASTSTTTSGTGSTAPAESCIATFHWLQKDAYKDTAGRTSSLWPPHTTTMLDVECQVGDGPSEKVATAFNANHGTEPGAVDKNGQVFLVEVRSDEVKGTREELLDLVAKYEACECDPSTKFLSLDSLQDAAVEELLQEVYAYLQTNLSCESPGGLDSLLQALQAGDVETVLMELEMCTWASGTDLASGFDQALSIFLAKSQEVLAGYHVCNNDAELQASLFQSFIDTKTVKACDGTAALCNGPKWFYEP